MGIRQRWHLLVAGAKGGLTPDRLHQEWKRIKEFPFDSEREKDVGDCASITMANAYYDERCSQKLFSHVVHMC